MEELKNLLSKVIGTKYDSMSDKNIVNDKARLQNLLGEKNTDKFMDNVLAFNSDNNTSGAWKDKLQSFLKPDTGDPVKPKSTSDRIPLPDYKNSQSRLGYAQAFKNRYGKDASPGFGEIPLRVNEKPVYGSDTSKNLAVNAAKSVGLDPSLLYASSMIEGQSGLYVGAAKDEKGNPAYRGYTGDKNFPVSGLWGFGLDSFQDYLPTLKKKGYLPADFDKEYKIWDKEGGPLGKDADPESVMFKSADAGVKAKAAMMKAFYDESDDYAKKKNIDLTPEQRDFFALAHFNSGEHGYQMLDAYNKAGVLKNDEYLKKMPDIKIPGVSPALHKKIYENVVPRIAAAKGLKSEGYFDEDKPKK